MAPPVLRSLHLVRNDRRRNDRSRNGRRCRVGLEILEDRITPTSVTGLSPSAGPLLGGTMVTISGTGFTGATAVDFGLNAGDGFERRERHHDHSRQPGGHRHRGRDRDGPGRDVPRVTGRPIHLRGRADRFGREPE